MNKVAKGLKESVIIDDRADAARHAHQNLIIFERE
jgi:hypothetical protein